MAHHPALCAGYFFSCRDDWKKFSEVVYIFLSVDDLGWDENEVVNIGEMWKIKFSKNTIWEIMQLKNN